MKSQVLLIGTGPAATAAAMALRRLGVMFEVLDVGHDLEPDRESRAAALATRLPEDWNPGEADPLFPAPAASTRGVQKRFAFGSEFPYRGHDHFTLDATDCVVDVSHALGGFGNVWGAAMLPWTDDDLAGWPLRHDSLAPSYRRVSQFVPTSAENDELSRVYPQYAGAATALKRSGQVDRLLGALGSRRTRLWDRGIRFGRARVAVDSTDGPRGCRYCGRCLEGCVYGSTFSPRDTWKQLMDEGVRVHRGYYALEARESGSRVAVTVVRLSDGTTETWETDRLLCAAGTMGSTRLMSRSLGLTRRPVRILDSQYFFFPLLTHGRSRDVSGDFTLAEAFIELSNHRVCSRNVHFQVYGMNEIFRSTLRSMVPEPLSKPFLMSQIEGRFLLFQGFLHSDYSGHMDMTITRSTANRDEVQLQGRPNPEAGAVARRAKRMLRSSLSGIGIVPPRALQMLPPGRSFHTGGSFPMGGSHSIFASDTIGRPAGLSRTHVLDASVFPSIPAATITLTAMANADRMVHAMAEAGMLS